MARAVLSALALLALLAGLWGDFVARTPLHQVIAQIQYLTAAVLFVGAEIIGAIANVKAAPKPEQDKTSSDAVVL